MASRKQFNRKISSCVTPTHVWRPLRLPNLFDSEQVIDPSSSSRSTSISDLFHAGQGKDLLRQRLRLRDSQKASVHVREAARGRAHNEPWAPNTSMDYPWCKTYSWSVVSSRSRRYSYTRGTKTFNWTSWVSSESLNYFLRIWYERSCMLPWINRGVHKNFFGAVFFVKILILNFKQL